MGQTGGNLFAAVARSSLARATVGKISVTSSTTSTKPSSIPGAAGALVVATVVVVDWGILITQRMIRTSVAEHGGHETCIPFVRKVLEKRG